MGKLETKSQMNGNTLQLTLSGTIDEDVDFNQIPISGKPSVELILGGVKSINSCGIREWIKWMGTTAGAEVKWSECPKVIVDQINMVDGFLPANGKVISFYVPYFCEDSGSEKNVLFRYGTEFSENQVTPPASVKDDDGNEMEMDVIEAKYFKFIRK